MSEERVLIVESDVRERMVKFFLAFRAMPDGGEILIRAGYSGDPAEAAIVIEMDGKLHGFTATQARIIALIAETAADTLEEEIEGLPSLIECLRRGAKIADKHFRKKGLH